MWCGFHVNVKKSIESIDPIGHVIVTGNINILSAKVLSYRKVIDGVCQEMKHFKVLTWYTICTFIMFSEYSNDWGKITLRCELRQIVRKIKYHVDYHNCINMVTIKGT